MGGLREAFAVIEGRAAPFYGLTASSAVAVPLLAGALSGHPDQGSMISLGAYLVAFTAPSGPYGARGRSLLVSTLMIAAGGTVGGLLNGHPWLAALIVSCTVAAGAGLPSIGNPVALAVLMTSIRPHTPDALYYGVLELAGGLLFTVLFLAPWPARRLRPLRDALAEAAEAVAGALDAVARSAAAYSRYVRVDDPVLAEVARHPPSWEHSYRHALHAVMAARTTFGLYRSGREDEQPTRPERIIDMLAQILAETSALRTLVEAAHQHPPRHGPPTETHIVITALATRVRLLAGAVEAPGQAPLGSTGSAAVNLLAQQTERIRQAARAGNDDLVAAALVDQVRRAVDRIAAAVETAGQIAEGGLRVRFAAPRLPTAPHPGSLWKRLARAIITRSPTFRQAARVGLAVGTAMTLVTAFGKPHGQWLTITVLFSLRGTYGETRTRIVQRIGGVIVGSVVAAVLLALAPGQVGASLVLFANALIGFTLRSVNYSYWAVFGTPITMMLLEFSTPSSWTLAGLRVALTIAGGVLAFLAVRLLWPAGVAELLPARLDRLLTTHAALVRAATAVVDGAAPRLALESIMTAERAVDDVSEIRHRLAHERLPDTDRITALRDAEHAAHRIRGHLDAVSRMSQEELSDAGPVPKILDRVAGYLETATDSVWHPPPVLVADETLDLQEELADLDEHLSALVRRRRSELESGIGLDEFTPLRRALLHVSGIRQALRWLRSDAQDLTTSSTAATR